MSLADRRNAAGLTRRAAASALGVHHKTLAAWERGDRDVRSGAMVAMAQLYGCTVADLFDDRASGRVTG